MLLPSTLAAQYCLYHFCWPSSRSGKDGATTVALLPVALLMAALPTAVSFAIWPTVPVQKPTTFGSFQIW